MNKTIFNCRLDDFVTIFENKNIKVEYNDLLYTVSELQPILEQLRVVNLKVEDNGDFTIFCIDNELYKVYSFYGKEFKITPIIFKTYYSQKMYDEFDLPLLYSRCEVTSVEYLSNADKLCIEFKEWLYD